MIKFTDVCKAYIRYWYIILICVALVFGIVFGVSMGDDEYTAISTVLVEKNETVPSDEFITQTYAESVIKEMSVFVAHIDCAKEIRNRVADKDPEFAKTLSLKDIMSNLDMSYTKGTSHFKLTYKHADSAKAEMIVGIATEVVKDENMKKIVRGQTKAQFDAPYSIQLSMNNKNGTYAVIGILIGLVLGLVIVTFFVVFNPFVENKELLEKETGIRVLATLPKRKEVRDEN